MRPYLVTASALLDLVTASALLALTVNLPAHAAPQHHSAYGGQQHRAIKGLSHEDVEELRRGGGWGLAKAAELNGMPGPAHVLELKDKIALTPDQTTTIKPSSRTCSGGRSPKANS